MQFTDLLTIKREDVEAYRQNTGYTSIYMKDGSTLYVLEDFEIVDEIFEL